MMSDKENENYKKEFGRLMMQYAITSKMINDFNKDLKGITDQIDKLMAKITGVNDNGSTVQQEK